MRRGFASDNNATIHPAVLAALTTVNQGHVIGYGDDEYTQTAEAAVAALFGSTARAFFVFTGSAANVLALQTMMHSYQAVICSEHAHIHVHETGAAEKFTQGKVITLPSINGKLTVDQIKPLLSVLGNEHSSQPRVLALTQPTELGAVYSIDEIRALVNFAHQHELYVYVDGARLANAAAALNVDLKTMITDTGVDAVNFGGTKNGAFAAEALIFLNPELHKAFKFIRKQCGQLASKMRFIAAQFQALVNDNLWLKNATHANQMAQLLASKVSKIPGITLTQPVHSNSLFARLPAHVIEPLQAHSFFYIWNADENEVRWVTSFDTDATDITQFCDFLAELCAH